MKNNAWNSTVNFLVEYVCHPVRIICEAIKLVLIWIMNGWIFHLLTSTIQVAISVAIMIGMIFVFELLTGLLDRINWESEKAQTIASKVSLLTLILMILQMAFGRHQLLFIILTAVLIAYTFRNELKLKELFEQLKKKK